MKKILCLILILSILLSMNSSIFVNAEENNFVTSILISPRQEDIAEIKGDSVVFNQDEVLKIFKEFQEECPYREGASEKEKETAEYLVQKLGECGAKTYKGSYLNEFSYYIDSVESSGLTYTEPTTGYFEYSQNVVGVFPSKTNTNKNVIIGAHYDNVDDGSQSLSGKEGAYDNGGGVAALLAISRELPKMDLPFNVTVVFFGMEESGLYGSYKFVSQMTQEEIDNTLLMINIDAIAGGDNLYIYSDEKPRTHEDIFFDTAKKLDFSLTKMPSDKRSNPFFNIPNVSKRYVNIGFESDNASFIEKDIPAVSFFGYNLTSNDDVNGLESEGRNNIIHTSKDNYKDLISIYGEDFIKNRLASVCSLILSTLMDDEFVDVMNYSKENPTVNKFFYSFYFELIVVGSVFLLAILAIVLIYNKLPEAKKIEPVHVIKKIKIGNDGIHVENINVENKKESKDKDDDEPDVFDF